MGSNVNEYVKEFVDKLKMTDEYIAYRNQLGVIKHFPDLMEQINKYREENFLIQNEYDGDELFDKMEEFNVRNEKFLENPTVSDFLHAEAGICRLIQEVNVKIMEGLDFE